MTSWSIVFRFVLDCTKSIKILIVGEKKEGRKNEIANTKEKKFWFSRMVYLFIFLFNKFLNLVANLYQKKTKLQENKSDNIGS